MATCAHCGREAPDDASFCSGCGARLCSEPAREERKVVTVLFADLVGFTGRAEQLDPEDVRALLSPYYARLRSELERYGGTVEKFIGDAVMALFGAPVAHEDDPERAVRAALAIRDAIAEEGELEVRIGITTGEALVALGARPAEGEGMAAGDVVNTAARLQAAAPANGVLVGESTFRATAQTIAYREAQPVVAKGKAVPVAVWEAVEPRSRIGVDLARRIDTPLVGRADEMALLTETLARTRRERSPQLVTLVGVPGIGKSRLVEELFESVDADPELISWRQGRCLPYGDGVTFWALAEMVKAHAGILDSDTADAAEEKLAHAVATAVPRDGDWVLRQLRPLAGLSTEDGGRAERRDEAFAAWRRFFESLAERGPLVLVFEDLHWADDGLLEFVDHLVDWASGVPLLVLCTARPELLARRGGWGGGKANASTISLSPLSDPDTARLVAELLGQAVLPEELQTSLLARAEGNPLYAEEYVRMLRDRGFLRREDNVWRLERTSELPLPETVQGIIAARLDALGAEEKRLVQDAAVVGKVFWSGALASLGGRERWPVEEALHHLERRELVRRDRVSSVRGETEYSFAHVLVRDVAYRQIPRGERARRHLAAAEWIESLAADRPEDHAEMLAHHYLTAFELDSAAASDDGLARRAVDALREAGDRARALMAVPAAVGFYQGALDLSRPQGRARADLLRRLGEARWTVTTTARGAEGGLDELAEALDLYLAEECDSEAAEVEVLLAEAAFDSGDGARAMELSRSVVERVQRLGPGPAKAYVVGWLAHRLLWTGIEAQRIEQLAEEAVTTARALGRPSLEATALNGLGIVQAMTGDSPTGIATLERAVEIAANASPFERVRSLGNLASLVQEYGDARRARRLHEEGLVLSREFAIGFAVRWLEAEIAHDRYFAGEWDACLVEADAYLSAAEADSYFMDPTVANTRGLVRLGRGDVAGATADSAWGLARARAAVESQVLLPALAFNARCSLEAGSPAAARSSVGELLKLIPDASLSPHEWFVQLAFVLRGLGEPERLRTVDLVDTRWATAARLLVAGREAEAADALHAIGSLPDEADARLVSGEPEHIELALAFYRSVGATAYATRAESLLARSRSA